MTKEEYIAALPIAKKQYDMMFNDLVTGIKNSINNFNGEAWRTAFYEEDCVNRCSYYLGKRDAFREIARRMNKEHRAHIPNERETLIASERQLGEARDADVERVFPDIYDSYCYNRSRTEKHRRVLAEMLKHYFMEGYRLGCSVNMTENVDIKPFNPDEFADEFAKAIINPLYLKEIEKNEQRDRTN